MIEVYKIFNGWSWCFISEEGRIIYRSSAIHATDKEANDAAKRVRASFHNNSKLVDDC